METKLKKITIIGLSALLFVNTVDAQISSDTTIIRESRETTITRDSVNKQSTIPNDTIVNVPTQPAPAPPAPTLPPPPPPTPAVVIVPAPKPEPPRLHNLELGLRFLPTYSSMGVISSQGDEIQGEASLSNGYGFMLGFNLTRVIGIQTEVNYLETSQTYKDNDMDRNENVDYLNIPVLLSLNTDKSRIVNWNFVAGPQLGINIGPKTRTSSNNNSDNNVDTSQTGLAVKKGDLGLAYGTGLEFMINRMRTVRIDVGFRGFYGLGDINGKNTDSDPSTYNVFQNTSRKTYGGYLGLTFLF